MKTTEEKNRMIAEFMGFELQNNKDERWFGQWLTTPTTAWANRIERLHFDSSWDWLVPVASKLYLESKNLNEMKSFRMSHIIKNYQTAVVNNEISVAHHYVLDGINLLNE